MLNCLSSIFTGDLKSLATPVMSNVENHHCDMNLNELLDKLPVMIEKYKEQHYKNTFISVDEVALVSAWSLDYLWKILPSIIVASCVLKRSLPLSIENIKIRINPLGTIENIMLTDEGIAIPHSSTQLRFSPLIEDHLTPIFKSLNYQFNVPEKILWGNAVRYIKNIFNTLIERLPLIEDIKLDQQTLLTTKRFEDGSYNPLYFKTRYIKTDNVQHMAHSQCCLYYKLPDNDYCALCPRKNFK